MQKAISRALWGAFFVGGLTVLGAGAAHAADTSGEDSVASGNQVGILGEAPVTVSGNAISILGDSDSSGTTAATSGGSDSTTPSHTTSGQDAIAGGNQVMPDAVAPVVVNGNAISILGDSRTDATQAGVADTSGGDSAAATNSGEEAIAGGNQVMPVADAPIIVGGNSISVIGDSSATGAQSSAAAGGTGESATANTTGEDAFGSGNQVAPGITAPISVGGNDVAVIRDSSVLGDDVLGVRGLESHGLPIGPVAYDSLIAEPANSEPLLAGPAIRRMSASGPVLGAPLVEGPLVGDVQLGALAPVAAEVVVQSDASADSSDTAPTPLMAMAALSPAKMMLAATGVEALPLIGGIAIMLATGLCLVGLKRSAHAIG